ncbi:MAG: MAPEG family protein [Stenotrophomonas sp.]|uniref:MAPEG family protein n=1 Tax=Stenotrophomonas sp. TaxID=69392 RepID=UPI003D6D1610
MQSTSAIALVGFIVWALLLLLAMEVGRVRLVIAGKFHAGQFKPDNSNLSPLMQRLTRAHANCIESFPLIGGLLLAAIATGHSAVTDPLALVVLGARLAQSSIHVASVNTAAVNLRFAAFAIQLAIAAYWAFALLRDLVS